MPEVIVSNYTIEELYELETAIATGVLVVMHNGVRVEYRSLAEMLRIAQIIRGELGIPLDNGRAVPRIRRLRYYGNKGFGGFQGFF